MNKGVTRCLDALDWISPVTSHTPDPHQQMVRYYDRYSNALSRPVPLAAPLVCRAQLKIV